MTWIVHTGDCRSVLAQLAEASVDTVICDPPYGLAFMGKDWDQQVPGADYWRAALRVAKPGAMLLAFGGTRTWHHLAVAIEAAGWEIRDSLMWLYGSGFPKSLDIAKAIDKAAGAEREVVGVDPVRAAKANRGTTSEKMPSYDTARTAQASGQITAPATDAAKRWHGWGTALKPAWEPIILAMKPLDGTFAENAQRHGVAGLAIDAGRIGYGDLTLDEVRRQAGSPTKGSATNGAVYGKKDEHGIAFNPTGRWPANVLLDEEAAGALDEQSGERPTGSVRPYTSQSDGFLQGCAGKRTSEHQGDTGGASRFFYVAKAARSERGIDNDHPTVKPIALMRYLCRLTRTPTGGVVLDPFSGSGSTGVGAMLDGRDFIGVEIDPHNAEIARQRIATADPIGRQEAIFG